MTGPVPTALEPLPLSLFRTSSQTTIATTAATRTMTPTRTRGSRAQDGGGRSFTTIQHRFRLGARRPARLQSGAPGRLAQLGEHQLDKLGVTGSSPVPPTSATHAKPALRRVSASRVSHMRWEGPSYAGS